MKVTDPNLASPASTGASRTQEPRHVGQTTRLSDPATPHGTAASDDIHLSELVRSLRSLAADSPERQARMEQIARAYASGAYQVDAEATAAKIIDDALR